MCVHWYQLAVLVSFKFSIATEKIAVHCALISFLMSRIYFFSISAHNDWKK